MDLQEIARRCDLPIRLIRYVLDHRVLPGQPYEQQKNERGQPRVVTAFEAFGIAIAAHLLNAGIRRANVAIAIKDLAEMQPVPKRHPRDRFFQVIHQSTEPSKMRIDSHGHIRCVSIGGEVFPGPAEGNNETVVVEIDLAIIRQQLHEKS
jgi:hypothetical protein